MRAPKQEHVLPDALKPESSYEYGCDEQAYPMTQAAMDEDAALYRRNRNATFIADKVYRGDYGQIIKVKTTRIGGKRWDFLERW